MESRFRKTPKRIIANTATALLDAVFPHHAPTTLVFTQGGVFFLTTPHLTLRCWSCDQYHNTQLRTLLHDWKYHGIIRAGEILQQYFAASFIKNSELYTLNSDLIVPIPLHPWRRAWRGFDQSVQLAQAISARTQIPVAHVLKRKFRIKTQASIDDHVLRIRNAASTYELCQPDRVQQEHVLLIDDVCTSGATALVCAQQLYNAGAVSVSLATLLRK